MRTAREKRRIDGGPLLIATCGRCGTAYQPTVPTADELERWYAYMADPEKVAREPSPLIGRRMARVLDSFERTRTTGRLLDIGCGRGELVLAAREQGWDVHATEISPSCVARLAPVLGAKLHRGEIVDAPFAEGSFDVVVMVEVLEHLPEPATYLEAARRLLRPGGIVFVTTPNYRGISGRWRGLDWRVVADEHLAYFNEGSLARLLRATGFARASVVTTGLDLPGIVSRLRSTGGRARLAGAGRVSPRRSLSAAVVDVVIEIANAALRVTHLGDGLRATATRVR